MSQIKLKHSGGNSVIIAAPDSNPASDRTLKLPSDGDGTILTTNSPTGKLLQVVQTVKKDTASYSITNPNFSSDIMTVSITPSNASNKIILECHIHISGLPPQMVFSKAGSILTDAIADAGNDGNGNPLIRATANVSQTDYGGYGPLNFKYIDTAGGTSAITYGVRITHINSSSGYQTATLYLNKTGVSGETDAYRTFARTISTLTATEIAA